jgi:putative exporter of polyketide antibiotics
LYAGKVIKEIDLVAGNEIKRNFFSFIGTTAQEIFATTAFKVIAAIVIIALIALIIIMRRNKARKRRDNYNVLEYVSFSKKK